MMSTRPYEAGKPVLLVDMGPLAEPFTRELSAAETQVVETSQSSGLVAYARARQPRLVIVGSQGDGQALPLISTIRAHSPRSLILYLAPSTAAEAALPALLHGADDAVAPPHAVKQVLFRARLAEYVRGGRSGDVTSDDPEKKGPILVDPASRSVEGPLGRATLTGRELDLLERLLLAGGRVVPREELLRDIWGEDQDSEAVLDATVHRLRQKLEADPGDPEVVTTVRGIGYRVDGDRVRLTGALRSGS
jgi:two-component system, OmpR family, response regulator RegX3